jgi:hypothetical protein
MGYASDLELLFVHEGGSGDYAQAQQGSLPFFEMLALQVEDFIEAPRKGIFHLDLRLRQ